jgi:hypothetical protein
VAVRVVPQSGSSPPPPLDATTMVCFRAGPLAEALSRRARRGGVGGAAKRDLGRYYWLLRVALAGSPPLSHAQTLEVAVRATAALAAEGTNGTDLTALVFACAEALPGWGPLPLLALADALERAPRDPGGRLTPEAVGRVLEG